MFLHRLTDTELRADCKADIEALEIWLRRVIDLTLSLSLVRTISMHKMTQLEPFY